MHGPLVELNKDWSARVGNTEVPGTEVVTLRRAGVLLPPFPNGEHLILSNGDRVPVRGVRLVGERLHFVHPELEGGKEASLPLAAVSVLWRAAPDQADDSQLLLRALAAESRSADVVLLRNGDRVSGTLNRLDADKAEVEAGKKMVQIPLAQVAALAFNTELVESLRPKGVYGVVTLTADGARLSVSSAVVSGGGHLEAVTAFGARLKVPLERVAALDLRKDSVVYLSDIPEAKLDFVPYLDEHWGLARDANATGHDLVVGGSTYAKGVGLHSQSRLTYNLGAKYRRFEALVGLDDRDGAAGSVRVHVLADGKPLDLGPDRERTAKGGPLVVGASVAGVRQLTLVVDFGANGNVGDVVNWADARLLR
jgi:hypothetical protein